MVLLNHFAEVNKQQRKETLLQRNPSVASKTEQLSPRSCGLASQGLHAFWSSGPRPAPSLWEALSTQSPTPGREGWLCSGASASPDLAGPPHPGLTQQN